MPNRFSVAQLRNFHSSSSPQPRKLAGRTVPRGWRWMVGWTPPPSATPPLSAPQSSRRFPISIFDFSRSISTFSIHYHRHLWQWQWTTLTSGSVVPRACPFAIRKCQRTIVYLYFCYTSTRCGPSSSSTLVLLYERHSWSAWWCTFVEDTHTVGVCGRQTKEEAGQLAVVSVLCRVEVIEKVLRGEFQ